MSRLSSSTNDPQRYYKVVVVGSGYGGAIAASRMARAEQSVCLLERGKEFQPGEYPDTELKAVEEMQVDAPGRHIGAETGLYDFRVNDDMNVFLGCGLGGTSLVNANVSLRANPRVFADKVWPEAIRGEAEAISHPSGDKPLFEIGYELAEQMLQPQPYPETCSLPKLDAQADSAKGLGARFYRPPINVTFKDQVNYAGVEQRACVNCGDCVTGCNYSAKNTVLMNYLPDAKYHGAEIFTEVSVRYVERKDAKWVVHFNRLDEGREEFESPSSFVTADIVVLSAGTLGSTEILLRSRQQGLAVSDSLGKYFSGNGDVLGFGYNTEQVINGIGYGHREPIGQEPVGPCITGIIDLREQSNLDDGMVIEEGSIPGALADIMPAAFAAVDGSEKVLGVACVPRAETVAKKIRSTQRELESLILGPRKGAVHNTQTYLVMTHDGFSGEMYLDRDRLRIKWPGVGDEPIFQKVKQNLQRATDALGGSFLSNPIWSELFRHELITVHPLGGCVMADLAENGVVNHKGQVFDSSAGTSVHEGLYVSDGSVIPRSLGVNPLLTISALAERCCQLIARDYDWSINYGKNDPIPPDEEKPKIGIQFTEKMTGYFSVNTTDTYEHGYDVGQAENSKLEFILTITSGDLNDMLTNSEHRARLSGTVTASALSPNPLAVSEGVFNLFVDNPDKVDTRNMWYRMCLTSEEGRTFFFEGFKEVDDTLVLHAWQQTTTLYVTIYDGVGAGKQSLGKGILRIAPADFARQMTTMRVLNAEGLRERADALARFGKFFAGVLWESYGGILARETVFDPDAPPRRKRPLRVNAPEVHFFMTSDNVQLKLVRYCGGRRGPVILSHGLGVSSLIFSIDTIETNLVEYLFAHGFDVWLLDHRASIDLPSSKTQFTADDVATKDYPAAVAKVQELTRSKTVQMVAHCYGSTTFSMALLAGLQGVRSAVCSQISTHIVAPVLNRIRTGLHLPEFLDRLGVKSLTAYVDTHADWQSRLFDDALRLYPIPERCDNPVCHRITFMYAPLYRHEQLNEATHIALHEMFGIANIEAFEGLALMTRQGHVVSSDGSDSYLPHIKRMAIPISFIHGQQNECFLPESTQITYDLLRQQNGGNLYTRHVIPAYGHIDCIFGKNAAVDVFPYILDHLDATNG